MAADNQMLGQFDLVGADRSDDDRPDRRDRGLCCFRG